MQAMILGGIAAVICWAAWQRHNRTLDEQAADSGRELKPVPTGFDYQAAREQTDQINSALLMLIQQTFELFVFRADRRLGLGIFKGYETNRIQKKRECC